MKLIIETLSMKQKLTKLNKDRYRYKDINRDR